MKFKLTGVDDDSEGNREEDDSSDEDDSAVSSTDKNCRCRDCLVCCYNCIRKYRLYCKSYSSVYRAYKVALTLSVSQVACERTFSKLKYVKNPLRNQLSDDHLDSFLMMCVEKDILSKISNNEVIDKLAESSTEMQRLLG